MLFPVAFVTTFPVYFAPCVYVNKAVERNSTQILWILIHHFSSSMKESGGSVLFENIDKENNKQFFGPGVKIVLHE